VKLRSHLLLLSLATAAPVVVLAAAIAVMVVKQERDSMRDAAGERVVAVLSAIDAEVRGSIATLRALAASRELEAGNLKGFHAEAVRVLATHPDWLNFILAHPDGTRLADAGQPPGSAKGMVVDRPSFDAALAGSEPVIGRVVAGPAGRNLGIPLRVAVRGKDDQPRFVITVVLRPESFVDVLREQRLPDGWVVNLMDHSAHIIARLPYVPAGTPASDSFRKQLQRSSQGWFRGKTLEGRDTYTPYSTSTLSGWTLGIAMPVEAVDAAAWRTLWALAALVLFASAVAVGLAIIIGRRIARPIASLAAGVPEKTSIDEINALGAAVRERQALIEREKAALQASDRAKDEFLAMLSHELRNPLAALSAAAHVVKLAPADTEAAVKARGVIERQTKHMARLVGDLLDISRVAMGKVALERERINLADVVASVAATWRASGRLERHQLAVRVVPVWVDADRARVEQVFSNLLDNAIKFTPAGKRIRVGVRQEGDHAVLQVSDEGEGLAPELAETAFGLFVQGERGLDRAAGGLGVGLALVKRLTEMHGGSVSAASEGRGKGATFTVKLPAVLPSAKPAAPEPHTPVTARRVLIVEDNDDTRQMMQEVLKFSGHDVRTARDGASGLALAAEARPDVALIDIGLPDVDGYEVARRMRAAPGGRRIGLVAITGYGQAEDQRRAYEAGFDAHLTKPVAPERLKQVMAGLR
jgi:signal transduction histidine kinase/CheY-like chemotaxis protein